MLEKRNKAKATCESLHDLTACPIQTENKKTIQMQKEVKMDVTDSFNGLR